VGLPLVDELLTEPFGNWHLDTVVAAVEVRVTKRGDAQVHRSAPVLAPSSGHDRSKRRRVDPGAPFLRELGISDAQGRVRPTRTDKYRQVEELVGALRPVLPEARDAEPLRIVDLGCGNAYLTFAAYAHVRELGRDVEMVGVDVKEQAREHNEQVAARLGWSDHLQFVAGTIGEADLGQVVPDVVLALHACDTATDDAIARAVRWQAPVLLAAPCCHHDLQRRVRDSGDAPAVLAPVLRFGLLRERQVDLLTDAWRALVLRLLGYRVEVLEFVDSRHTPRNALLRAVRTGAPATEQSWREHAALSEQWGCVPYLADVLTPELEAAHDQ
jgi:SAM-dependent methyltransferase